MDGNESMDDVDNEDPSPMSFSIPVSNSFDPLSLEGGKPASSSNDPATQTPAIHKLKLKPVVTFPNGNSAVIRGMLKGNNYTLRNCPDGVKVFPVDEPAHQSILDELSAAGYKNHFSHGTGMAKPKKFVLFGPDPLAVDVVKKMLEDAGLHPTLVTSMRIKNRRYTDEANYLIHFNRDDDINLSSLRLVRDLERTLVSWSHYKSKAPEVCVCYNCCSFGHGKMRCFMPPKCVICARAHAMEDCPFLKDKIARGLTKIATKHLRCANCSQNHTATYRECSERKKFLDNRKPKAKGQQQPQTQHPPPLIQLHKQPLLDLPSTSASIAPSLPTTAAGLFKVHQTPFKEQVQPDNLISVNDCQSMLNDIFQSLQSCNNYYEQAKVIFDLGIKYFAKFAKP